MKNSAILFCLIGIFILLSGCGMERSVRDAIAESYPLTDTVQSSFHQGDVSYVYSAQNESIDQVRQKIVEKMPPNQQGENESGTEVLIYDDYLVTLTQNEDDSNETIIEVATLGFVRDNFSPSFFHGMLAMWVLDEILDVDDWGKKQRARCAKGNGNCYGGYVYSGGRYKGPVNVPSFRGSAQRGGGPGTGK